MFFSCRNRQASIDVPPLKSSTILLRVVEVAKDGRISRTTEFKPVDNAESLKEFHSSDFDVSSLLAVGGLSKLKTTFMSPTSATKLADSFDNLNFQEDVSES